MTEELKPCPFCGEKAYFDEMGRASIVPVCAKGKCLGRSISYCYSTRENAARAWNTRHQPVPLLDKLNELAELRRDKNTRPTPVSREDAARALEQARKAIDLADKFFNQSAGFKTEFAYDRKAFDKWMEDNRRMHEEVAREVKEARAALSHPDANAVSAQEGE
jgi:hypothetical protein